MNIHKLKTDPDSYCQMTSQIKKYELRFDDRKFKCGDELQLEETRYSSEEMKAGKPLEYTGRIAVRRVDWILKGYGLLPGWVILSVTPV